MSLCIVELLYIRIMNLTVTVNIKTLQTQFYVLSWDYKLCRSHSVFGLSYS